MSDNPNMRIIKESIAHIEAFASERIDPNAAADFIKSWPNKLVSQKTLSAIYNDSTISPQDKKIINRYKDRIGIITKVLKTTLNFKPFFDLVKSAETISSAYIQEEINKAGLVTKEPDYELQRSLEEK